MNQWITPVLAAAFISCGFALLYHMNEVKLLVASLGGALNWAIYLLCMSYTDKRIMSFFVATAATALFAEILARIIKVPVITLIVPMLIPMVPGSDLYYSTFALVQGNMHDFGFFGLQLILEVGAMSLGLIVIACFVQTVLKIQHFCAVNGVNGVRPR